MHPLQTGSMKHIEIKNLNQLIIDYHYLYLPYLFKLKLNKDKFKSYLNSLAIRHPNRVFLKKFINDYNFNDKDFEALDFLLWKWKGHLSREWYPFIFGLKQDLQISEKLFWVPS